MVAAKTTTATGTKGKFVNVIANPFLCIRMPSLYITLAVYIFSEKEVNKMLLFIVNVGIKK